MSHKFETLQIHAGHIPDKTGARAVPIYQTSSFLFADAEEAADLFALKKAGNIYTRLGNPTTAVLEERIAALEGGISAVATASGMSAITYALLNLAQAGNEIVSVSTLYGGTHTLFANAFRRFAIKVILVDPDDPKALAAAITPKTKAVYTETIGNPGINVTDLEALAAIAREHRLPLIVDNTFATPYLCRPLAHGANIVIHSTTKFISGSGTALGGIVVDGGNFPWQQADFPDLTQPEPSYHGVCFTDSFGAGAYAARLRLLLLRDLGAAPSPFNSFLQLLGAETLSLRMERHVANTKIVTEYLAAHPAVAWVNYPGLRENKYFSLAQKYLPRGAGSIFTFGLKGGYAAGKSFLANLKIFSHLANVGDAKSLVIHPASTTHQQLTAEEQERAGVYPELVRVSVGLENADDLLADLEQALGQEVKA